MSTAPSAPLSRGALAAAAAGLLLSVLLVYGRSVSGDFVYDDLLVIKQNPQITSFGNVPEIFGSSYWDFLDAEGASHVGYYRPLTMVLLIAGYVFGGGEPTGFHVLSLLVYGCACLAAWRFAVRLTRSEPIGFAAALLFALHPLHVESVAWISALHDPLFATFAFLSMNAFLRWRDEGSVGRPWRSGVWFLLALLSKDTAVAVLPLLVAIDWGRNHLGTQPDPRRLAAPARAYVPVAIAFLGYYLLRTRVFESWLAGFDRQTTEFGVGLGRLLLLRVELLGGTAALLAWPLDLNLFRPFKPDLPAGDPSLIVGVIGSAALVAVISVALVKRWRPGLAMLLIIPCTLAPVLLRVQSLGTFPLSDRFLFLPVIGFTLLLAWVLFTRLPRGAAIGIVSLVAIGYGYRAYTQIAYWKNEEVLFARAVEQNPRNPNVHWGMGRVLLGRYERMRRPEDLKLALESFENSMNLLEESQTPGSDIFATKDDFVQTNLGLGWSLFREAEIDAFHDFATPRDVFERVIDYAPESERGHIGVGNTWIAEGDPNKAGESLRRAIALNERSPEAHFNMGMLLIKLGEWEAAAEQFRTCTELRNDNPADHAFLARTLHEAGRDAESYEVANRAHGLHPEDPDPMVVLGLLSFKAQRFTEALGWFDQALEAFEYHGAAHLFRGKTLHALGQNKAAAAALKTACELMPGDFDAHSNFAMLLMASSNPGAAVPVFLRAYQLRPSGEMDAKMRQIAEALPPNDLSSFVALAFIDADRGDLESALRWGEKVLALDPDHGPIHYVMGSTYKKRQELEQAYPHLRAAADSLVDSYEAQMELGDLLLMLNREREAAPYLAAALRLLDDHPMDPEARKVRKRVIEQALEEIEKLDRIGPPPPDDGE